MTVLKTSGNEVVADFNENSEPTFVKVAPRYQFIEVDKKKFRISYYNHPKNDGFDFDKYQAEILTDTGWQVIASRADIDFIPTDDYNLASNIQKDAVRYFRLMREHINMLYL